MGVNRIGMTEPSSNPERADTMKRSKVSSTKRPVKHRTPRDCESLLEQQYPGHPQAQDGQIWTCPCGRRFQHLCDEAEGCSWGLVS